MYGLTCACARGRACGPHIAPKGRCGQGGGAGTRQPRAVRAHHTARRAGGMRAMRAQFARNTCSALRASLRLGEAQFMLGLHCRARFAFGKPLRPKHELEQPKAATEPIPSPPTWGLGLDGEARPQPSAAARGPEEGLRPPKVECSRALARHCRPLRACARGTRLRAPSRAFARMCARLRAHARGGTHRPPTSEARRAQSPIILG